MIRANLLAVALAAASCAAVPAFAQDAPTSAPATAPAPASAEAAARSRACFDAMPASALEPTVQYLRWISEPAPNADEGAYLDALVQVVAERVRAALGAHGDTLPRAEPRLTWNRTGPALGIVVGAGGTLVTVRDTMADSVARGTRLLREVIEAARADGDLPPWPEGARDGLVARLEFEDEDMARSARPVAGPAVPVFSRFDPRGKPAGELELVRPHYPERLVVSGIAASLTVEFVVEPTGLMRERSLRVLETGSSRRLFAAQPVAYRELVSSIRVSLQRSRFYPAEIGPCPVAMVVQKPYSFELGGALDMSAPTYGMPRLGRPDRTLLPIQPPNIP